MQNSPPPSPSKPLQSGRYNAMPAWGSAEVIATNSVKQVRSVDALVMIGWGTAQPQRLGLSAPGIASDHRSQIGACAMTTKLLDTKMCSVKIVLSSKRFPRRTAFWDDFPLCPHAPRSKNANSIFTVLLSLNKGRDRKDFLQKVCIISHMRQSQCISSLSVPEPFARIASDRRPRIADRRSQGTASDHLLCTKVLVACWPQPKVQGGSSFLFLRHAFQGKTPGFRTVSEYCSARVSRVCLAK